jgi:hypothetical protein
VPPSVFLKGKRIRPATAAAHAPVSSHLPPAAGRKILSKRPRDQDAHGAAPHSLAPFWAFALVSGQYSLKTLISQLWEGF